MWSFLGFINYYCRFITKNAQVAKPVYKLISGENAARKQNSVKWDPEYQEAFDKLKELCTTTPDRVEKVISNASRSLTKSGAKYPVHKLEFLSLKWAITDQFHEYLYGNTFDVYTDNNPLTYVLTTAKLDAMGHRWIIGLANYNFHIHYKSGKSNVEVRCLVKD